MAARVPSSVCGGISGTASSTWAPAVSKGAALSLLILRSCLRSHASWGAAQAAWLPAKKPLGCGTKSREPQDSLCCSRHPHDFGATTDSQSPLDMSGPLGLLVVPHVGHRQRKSLSVMLCSGWGPGIPKLWVLGTAACPALLSQGGSHLGTPGTEMTHSLHLPSAASHSWFSDCPLISLRHTARVPLAQRVQDRALDLPPSLVLARGSLFR